ncbi:GMC oxidoreductase [Rhizoctonia solani]|uniref:GMC oxidoreductase n=1 Tax=Rhizoctonia solani TaxID=456999 RepID=A0A8H8NQA5_9AGAM|nr:GMC oxidoreductase [Rhizoctonia solani]QRW17345.1 GMC oxidoreductase [Rhizoctonia solani]
MPRENDPVTQRLAIATCVGEAMVYQLMKSTESPSRCPRQTEHGQSDPIWCLDSATLLDIACVFLRFPPLALATSTSMKICNALAFLKWAAIRSHEHLQICRAQIQPCRCHGKGVFFHFKSESLTAEAGKEVVLSAALELSGAGNSKVLQKHKITPKADLLGAGENCQDCVSASTAYEVKKASKVRYGKACDRPLTASHSLILHIGLYFLASSARIVHMHKWLWEDVRKEIHMVLPNEQYRIEELLLRKKMSNVEMLPHPGKYTVRDFPKSLADRVVQQSRITDCHAQHLNTADSLSPPAMDANYLSKQVDRSILVELVKFADKLAMAEPLATILVARQGPSPDSESDKVIAKRAKGNNQTLHHPIGTAVMASGSLGGVVDEMPKAYGTSSLRVMKASVIPVRLAVQLHYAVYGTAERATDAIKSGSGF